MPNTPSSKPVKQGIIRWAGLIPITLIVGGFTAYFVLFFDGHLRGWIEQMGSRLNGAKVDIAFLKTSLLNTTFEIRGVEIANPAEPMKNRVELSRIYYSFLFRPIFQKKFVIKEASVNGIRWGTERTRSGKIVLPPPRPQEPGAMHHLLTNLEKVANRAIEKASIAPFAALSTADLGSNLEQLGESSNSFKKLKELENQLAQAQQAWQQAKSSLPSPNGLDELKSKAEALAREKPARPDDFVALLSKTASLKQEAQNQVGAIKKVHDTLTGETQAISQEISSIDQAIGLDIAAVRGQLKIPSVDLKDITPALLGPQVYHYLRQAIYWADLTRRYLPAKSKTKTARVEKKRLRGTDIHFSPVRSYPTFLLEKVAIESNIASDSRAGNVLGQIRGLNSDPPTYGKPTLFELKGEFPAAKISGAQISLSIDHVTENAVERAKIRLAAFPIEEAILASDPGFYLGIESASGKANIDLAFFEDRVEALLGVSVVGVRYRATSTNQTLARALQRVVGSLAAFDLKAKLNGPFDNLNFEVRSDLGEKLATALTSEFRRQIDDLNTRIRKDITGDVENRRKEFTQRLETEKQKALAPVTERLRQAQSVLDVVSQAHTRIESEKSRLTKQIEGEARNQATMRAQQEAEKLKQSIKLPKF